MAIHFKLKFAVLEVYRKHGGALDHLDCVRYTQAMLNRMQKLDGWSASRGAAERIVAEYRRQYHTKSGDTYRQSIAAELRHAQAKRDKLVLLSIKKEEPEDTVKLRPFVGTIPRRLGLDHHGTKPCLLIPRAGDRYYCEPASIADAEKLREWLRCWIAEQPAEVVEM